MSNNNHTNPIKLTFSLYCPDCDTKHRITCNFDEGVQAVVEEIEDARLMCPECGYMFMGIHDIEIADHRTDYIVPLWHGPVPKELE